MRTILLPLLVFYFLCLSFANAEDNKNSNHEEGSRFVVIDQRDSAYIVFTGIRKNTDEKKLGELRTKVAELDNVSMVTWEQFTVDVDKYAQSVMKTNDYTNYQVIKGLMCLVWKQPGGPWGLTWNGGIALTFNDYRYAKQRYESYTANPDSYSPMRDPRRDPINPGGFLPAFGCL